MRYKVSLNSENNYGSTEFGSFSDAYCYILRELKIIEAEDSEVRRITLPENKTKIEVIKPASLRGYYAIIQETSS
jgi:hypothetical protein